MQENLRTIVLNTILSMRQSSEFEIKKYMMKTDISNSLCHLQNGYCLFFSLGALGSFENTLKSVTRGSWSHARERERKWRSELWCCLFFLDFHINRSGGFF